MSADIFRDFARDVFGIIEVPETIPLKVLGLKPPIPEHAAIVSAFRRRVVDVHPDLQLAYDHHELQAGAEAALGTRPEIREARLGTGCPAREGAYTEQRDG